MLIAFLATACLSGCGREKVPDLRAAEVPVHALIHHVADPTVAFPESFPLQVAVYWSKPDEDILGVVHSLREMGIPFFVTRDLDRALQHRLVIIYPTVDGRTFTESQVRELCQYVETGGSLFAVNVFAGALRELFGFTGFEPSRKRYRVDFEPGSDAILKYLNRPEEQEVRLGDPKYGNIFWTNGYKPDTAAKVLARFADGSAALIRKTFGSGSTYLCGISFQDVVLRSQVNRDFDAERHYVNVFEPGADVWMLLLRAWYESIEPDAVRLATIPNGQSSVLLLSHDVDWEDSFGPALDFARMENDHHALSTFFIQTKYVSDYNSHAFFFGTDLQDLQKLFAQGFSIGSHSIIHSRGFNRFKLGSGAETFASYRPHATGFETASGATVFGEVRVSEELLNGELPGQHTVFFRAGHLRVPPSLPEALQRCGYEFDSSFTAADVLTNFPYALPLNLGFTEDSALYEFPVTFEDQELPPLPQRVDKALDVIQANAENGGINVILIHSTETQTKLPAEEMILDRLPPNVSATDMLSFARFWRARDRLRWTVHAPPNSDDIILNFQADEPASGLTVEFQRLIAHVEGGAMPLEDHHRIVLPAMKSGENLSVRVRFQRRPILHAVSN
ncbi:MAG: hypothetical protein DMG32_19035 [Acidobacteria bacterium]|nr:MAG: hypothetical protein DMG32_19035 [Acidobacteriota bacterium]